MSVLPSHRMYISRERHVAPIYTSVENSQKQKLLVVVPTEAHSLLQLVNGVQGIFSVVRTLGLHNRQSGT